WTADAVDQAGNKTTRSGTATINRVFVTGTDYRDGAYVVAPGDHLSVMVFSDTRPTWVPEGEKNLTLPDG
ncbi:hypothetical protein, partial [Jatrophihabitans endophyticus]|uniref:hypothetical protein n=1 Tax=Jatrophihabitans endophyticus TaxID=1206085 RepID=UPI001A10A659